ncbi:MAG: hypothetical protein QM617_07555 [Comamonas sp.]
MSSNAIHSSSALGYLACVPHVPLTKIQESWDVEANAGFWKTYKERVAELRAFDPELVIIFGGNHDDGVFLKLNPQFMVIHAAQSLEDCGGWPAKFDVPLETAAALTDYLIEEEEFDVAQSYAADVDHGFSNALHYFLGDISSKPVLPIHINTITDPRPTLRRCRQLGEAVGRFARTLNKRVAFLGTGGLSHQTDFVFPQYATAPSEDVRNYLVHGGEKGPITREKWRKAIDDGMAKLSRDLVDGNFHASWVNPEWDKKFLDILTSGDLTPLDAWTDKEVLDAAGYGGSEIRLWVAAAAAAQAYDSTAKFNIDYYSGETTLAVGVGVVHGNLQAA